jgi:hypothetical protein
MRAFAWATLLAATSAGVALAENHEARGQISDQCAAAYEGAQVLRRDGKLVEAHRQLLVCAAPQCPQVTTSDCARWLHEVEDELPTIVVSVRDNSGVDFLDAELLVDGKPVAKRLDGNPIAIDPGQHTLAAQRSTGQTVEQQVLVRAAEKDRLVTLVLPAGPPPSSLPPPERVAPPHAPVPVGSYVFAGLGLVAVGAGVILDVGASNDVANMRRDCAPACSPDAKNSAQIRMLLGDTLLGLGVVSIGVATWLWFHRQAPTPQAARVTLTVIPLTTGTLCSVAGQF